MSKTIIEIKNLGKKYQINHQRGGYVALRDVITNIFKNLCNSCGLYIHVIRSLILIGLNVDGTITTHC